MDISQDLNIEARTIVHVEVPLVETEGGHAFDVNRERKYTEQEISEMFGDGWRHVGEVDDILEAYIVIDKLVYEHETD